jgi:hypothetical protein
VRRVQTRRDAVLCRPGPCRLLDVHVPLPGPGPSHVLDVQLPHRACQVDDVDVPRPTCRNHEAAAATETEPCLCHGVDVLGPPPVTETETYLGRACLELLHDVRVPRPCRVRDVQKPT